MQALARSAPTASAAAAAAALLAQRVQQRIKRRPVAHAQRAHDARRRHQLALVCWQLSDQVCRPFVYQEARLVHQQAEGAVVSGVGDTGRHLVGGGQASGRAGEQVHR